MDPAEIRRRNFIPADRFPYRTHLGDLYDAGNFAGVLDKLVSAADWNGFASRKDQARQNGRLRGRGLSVYLEWTGALPTETVSARSTRRHARERKVSCQPHEATSHPIISAHK